MGLQFFIWAMPLSISSFPQKSSVFAGYAFGMGEIRVLNSYGALEGYELVINSNIGIIPFNFARFAFTGFFLSVRLLAPEFTPQY